MKFVVVALLLPLLHAWDFMHRMGSRTNYFPRQDAANYSSPPGNCNATPAHAELVSRHGTRFATANQGAKLTALQKKLKAFNTSTPAWLRNWAVPSDPVGADMLHPVGEREQYNMGKRFRQNYPNLFATPYYPSRFPASSTYTPRTAQSAIANLFGCLEGTGVLGNSSFKPPVVITNSPTSDTVLRFFDTCPYYTSAVINVINTNISDWATANLGDVLQTVQNQVGNAITMADLIQIWGACGFEVSLLNNSNIMCQLFNDTSAAMMDLYSQFESYYEKGPGVNLSYAIAAPLVLDILSSMQTFVTNGSKTGNPLNFRFAHAETIAPLAAYLGLFSGPAVDFNAVPSTLFTRQWDDSNIISYGSNIMFLMYECTDGFTVKLLYNEKETQIPGCGSMYCPWSTFSNLYPQAATFNFATTCNPTFAPSTAPSSSAPSSVSSSAPSSVSSSAPSSVSSSAPSSASVPTPVCTCNNTKVSSGMSTGPQSVILLLLAFSVFGVRGVSG